MEETIPSETDELQADLEQLKLLANGITQKIEARLSNLKEKEEAFERNHKIIEKITKKKVKLDVGGKVFSCSLNTLIKEEPSYFSAMFSGRYKLEKDEEDGSYFIDRNPTYFEIILDYLRTGKLRFAKFSPEEIDELTEEAEFYQIPTLIAFLKPQTNFLSSFDSSKAPNFTLSTENSCALCTGTTWNIAVADKVMRDGVWFWEVKVLHSTGHNDRIGLIEESELSQLAKPLTTFALYLYNNPGSLVFFNQKFKAVKPLTLQITVNHTIGFLMDFRINSLKIFANKSLVAEYIFPSGDYLAAFGSSNNGSKVQFVQKPAIPL